MILKLLFYNLHLTIILEIKYRPHTSVSPPQKPFLSKSQFIIIIIIIIGSLSGEISPQENIAWLSSGF